MSSPARKMLLVQYLVFLSVFSLGAVAALSSSSVALENGARVKLQPTLEEIPGGSRAIWQIPASPEAILFVAHGLNHGPEVFWDPNSSCPACSGLPEERLITMTALARRYAVLTVAALMNVGWDKRTDLEVNVDFQQVTAFLRSWRERHSLTNLPLTAFGLSRGGDFASLLPLGEKVEGLVLMISGGNDRALAAASTSTDGGLWPYPPTLFIYMPKDNMTADSVKENTALLSSKGLNAENLLCNPFPVYETYFSERITGLDRALSQSIFRALRAKGYLTPEGYVSKPDPVSWENYGHWDWSRVVRKLRVLPYEGNASYTWDEEVAEEGRGGKDGWFHGAGATEIERADMTRGNQRDRDRERAASRTGAGKKGKDDGLKPEQRRERDAKALQEKTAKKAGTSGDAGGAAAKAPPK